MGESSPNIQWAIMEWHQLMGRRGSIPQQEHLQQQTASPSREGATSTFNPINNLAYELREMRMGQEQFFQRFETRFDNLEGKVETRMNELRSDVKRFQEPSD